MNELEGRMLALLAAKMRARLEIAADLDLVATQVQTSRQTQEDWIQLAEKASQPTDAAAPQGSGT